MPASDFLSFNSESASDDPANEPSLPEFNFTGSLMDRAARRGTLMGDIDQRARRILTAQAGDEPALDAGRYRLSQMEGEQALAAARRRASVAETDAHYQRLATGEDLLHRAALEAPQLAARLDAEIDPAAIESHAADFLSRYASVAGAPEFGARFDRLAAPISHLVATNSAALRQRYTAAAQGLWQQLDPDDPESLRRIEASPFFEIAQRDPDFARAFAELRRRLTAGSAGVFTPPRPPSAISDGGASSLDERRPRWDEINRPIGKTSSATAAAGSESVAEDESAADARIPEALHFDGAYRGAFPATEIAQQPAAEVPGVVSDQVSASPFSSTPRSTLDDFSYRGGRQLSDPLLGLGGSRRSPAAVGSEIRLAPPSRPPTSSHLPVPPKAAGRAPSVQPPSFPANHLASAESSITLIQGAVAIGQMYIDSAKRQGIMVAREAYLRGDITAEDYVDIGDGVRALRLDNPGMYRGAEAYYAGRIKASVERRLNHIAQERKSAPAPTPGGMPVPTPVPIPLDANQLMYRARQGESMPVHRIGGLENLSLSEADKQPNGRGEWGLSVLLGGTPAQAAQQMRDAFPKGTRIREWSAVTASSTVKAIEDAGYRVVPDMSRKLPNHALINHPDGVAGYEENLKKLRAVMIDTPTAP